MKFIGITGGVGAGKSKILHYIEKEYPARILLADELAHELMCPGTACYREIRAAFQTEEIYLEDGSFDAGRLASVIFSDEQKRKKMNTIVHPAVKREIIKLAEQERQRKKYAYLILEAALLIEEGYDKICDELWYIDTSEEIRRKRLKENRGYSDEKIDAIFGSQLREEEYRKHCKVIIENNHTLNETFCQIRAAFDEIENGKNKEKGRWRREK